MWKLSCADTNDESNIEKYIKLPEYSCSRSEVNGIDILSDVYGDFLVLDTSYVIVRYVLVGIWIAFMIFGIISLIVKLIRLIISKIRRTENDIPLGLWSTLSSIIAVLPSVIIFICMNYGYSTGNLSKCYKVQLILFFILAAVYIVAAIMGAVKLFSSQSSRKRLIYNSFVELSLVYGIFSVFFWELYKFWIL